MIELSPSELSKLSREGSPNCNPFTHVQLRVMCNFTYCISEIDVDVMLDENDIE